MNRTFLNISIEWPVVGSFFICLPGQYNVIQGKIGLCNSCVDPLSYADDQGGLPQYVSAQGLVQQINQVQSELETLRYEMHHSLLHDKQKCINDLYVPLLLESFSL